MQNLYTTVPLVRLNATPIFLTHLPVPEAPTVPTQAVPIAPMLQPAPTAIQSFLDRQAPQRRPFSYGDGSARTDVSCPGLTLGPSTYAPTDPIVSLSQQHDSAAAADVASGSQPSMFVHGPQPKPYVRGRVEALESVSPQTPSPVLREHGLSATQTPEGWRSQWRAGNPAVRPLAVDYTSPTQQRRQEIRPYDLRRTATVSPRALRSSSVRPAPANLPAVPHISEREQWLGEQRPLLYSFGFDERQCFQIALSANKTVRRALPNLLPQLLQGGTFEGTYDYFTPGQLTDLVALPGAGQFLPQLAAMIDVLMERNCSLRAIEHFVCFPHASKRLRLFGEFHYNFQDASENVRAAIMNVFLRLPQE